MSFSSEVKDELEKQIGKSRHCRVAELAAILAFDGKVETKEKQNILEITTENAALARKCFTLIKKTFNIGTDIEKRTGNGAARSHIYVISTNQTEEIDKILTALKMKETLLHPSYDAELVNGLLIQNACCKRAFVRGAFLAAGSMSDPGKSYHFEIVCATLRQAEQLQNMIHDFEIDAKIVTRKKNYVVYIKEGAQIVDMLNIMEAHVALMNLENVRILKEMRNSVNRKVNCETANINKTVNAAVKQIEDIRLIEEKVGIAKLPDSLRKMAEVRLEYPEAALKELGTYLQPPVGKSGVNHRLRKLGELAEKLRDEM